MQSSAQGDTNALTNRVGDKDYVKAWESLYRSAYIVKFNYLRAIRHVTTKHHCRARPSHELLYSTVG
ncbi:MAG: hypothetical protein LH609_10290 [Rudanella sp.]|nr:hypothetical protein [Rudanella sp.]